MELGKLARCCGGGSCSCKIEAGPKVTVTGIGSSSDPFVIAADVSIQVVDTTVFNLTLSGDGSTVSPWVVTLAYAATAKLNDIPDVNADAPTNGQVLAYNTTTSTWGPVAPTTAATGAVVHDLSLSGDGSAGTPLQVLEAPTRYLSTDAAGLGVTTAGINSLVRKFADSTARAAASPAPVLNSLSSLDNAPGKVDYWNGAAWISLEGAIKADAAANQFLQLSGAYANTAQLTMLVRNFSGVTDSSGNLTVIPSATLSGKAGVLSVGVTVTGAQSYMPVLGAGANYVFVQARRLDDGALLVSQAITGQVTAYVY